MKIELKTNIPGCSIAIVGEVKNVEDYHNIKDLFDQIVEEERAMEKENHSSIDSVIKPLKPSL